MIKDLAIRFMLLFTLNVALGQVVPEELTIGDLTLQLTENARRQIQGDVDRLTASQTYYGILVDRMNLYFPIIADEFEKAGVPKEIMFLSIQESALISDAVSSANAVGFWQFKDFTAREMGLRVDRQVDERQNIRAASRGAAKYLNGNNFFFDNWAYAVLSYQAGVAGAQKHVNESDFGAKKMKITTRSYWYVKKFIAHLVAFAPTVGLAHSENLWLEELTDVQGKTLAQIARDKNIDIEEVKKYNKWLKGPRVPDDKNYSIFIPRIGEPPKKAIAKKIEPKSPKAVAAEPEKIIYPTAIAPGIIDPDKPTVIPLNGIPTILAIEDENVMSLAAKGGLTEDKFRRINDMGPSDELIPNEFYYIKQKKSKSKISFHVVDRGETLWDVSQLYGIKLTKLAKKNRMSIIDEVDQGRVLWLRKKRPADVEIAYHNTDPTDLREIKPAVATASVEIDEQPISTPIPEPIKAEPVDSSAELKKVKIHTVAKGESLWGIAQKYSVKMDDLLRWNELENPDQLKIGQNILVKPPIQEASVGKTIEQHTVEPGDTLYSISRKYGMTLDELMDLNDLTDTSIDVGAKLRVFKE